MTALRESPRKIKGIMLNRNDFFDPASGRNSISAGYHTHDAENNPENQISDERPMNRTILVVDDKVSMRRLVQDYLQAEGFHVVTAENGRTALYSAQHEKPDLILLDIMMPEMDGYEFLRAYRKEQDTPVILLTARLEETDKVAGLELGADDYITKPFGMRELVARIRAVLRRAGQVTASSSILRVADITLDQESREVHVGETLVSLTPSEFDLLAALMAAPGRVFSREDLLRHLPGLPFEGAERSVDVHISNLRKKIEQEASSPRYIETVFGVGYRFSTRQAR
jgi:two-component system, OmpR family, alkaline phosphatase synthesis response regulator PhoP